jgi:crotonobetainyl-CoA:carnitine CoA-transferase CaiB-like acyl-CoA transferase
VQVEAGAADGNSWEPTPARPLAGIKVLDCTRVVAGPTGTRFLAACGAEVLRLDAPAPMNPRLPGRGSPTT